MADVQWTRIAREDEVTAGAPRTFRVAKQQIVVFRLGSGELHAIDNRCPHEGYPLSTGRLEDGVLTCEWHNWKFRLCDGACILGGEGVRRYPVRVSDGALWLDLSDPPGDERQPGLFQSLETAFGENDWGHAARTVERLLAAGSTPAEIIGFGCDWSAPRARYGFDHGLAAAADLAAVADDFPEAPGVPILEALNLLVEPNLRRPVRERGAAVVVEAGDWETVEARLRDRIEAEDLTAAEGLLRGALVAGAGPTEVFRWLTHAATDHFLGYGHAHIYCVKAAELLEFIGWEHAEPVLTSLVASIVYDTREDRLPYMRAFGRAMESYRARLPEWAAGGERGAAPDVDAMLAAVLDGSLPEALAAVAAELARGVAPDRVALVLGLASAHRLLRFDARLDARDDVSEDWLNITHLMTHADAVRESARWLPTADCLRGLFHSARFIQHAHPCDLPFEERPRSPRSIGGREPPDADELVRALREHDAPAALAATTPGASRDAGFVRVLRRFAIEDAATLPIFVAHHIKTTMAALRLTDALHADAVLGQRDDRELPLRAAVRFMAHSLVQRRIVRRALVARDFVTAGEMPTRLLGY